MIKMERMSTSMERLLVSTRQEMELELDLGKDNDDDLLICLGKRPVLKVRRIAIDELARVDVRLLMYSIA